MRTRVLDRHTWGAVYDPLVPNQHIAWASIENGSINAQVYEQRIEQGTSSMVLQACTFLKKKGEDGRTIFRKFGISHSVCCVLFVV
jgi:hypothetical protein